MRFLASWWERIPSRLTTSVLITIFVAAGLLGAVPQVFTNILGHYWE